MEHLGYIPINKLRIEIWSLWISRLVGLFRTKTNSHGAWKGHTWQYPKNTCDCWFIIIRLSYSFRKHNIWLPTMVKWFWPLMIEHDRPIYIYILLQRDMLLEAHPLKKNLSTQNGELSSILFDEYKGVMKPLASERWWWWWWCYCHLVNIWL